MTVLEFIARSGLYELSVNFLIPKNIIGYKTINVLWSTCVKYTAGLLAYCTARDHLVVYSSIIDLPVLGGKCHFETLVIETLQLHAVSLVQQINVATIHI